MFLFGTMPFYQPTVLLSSHQKHVDGFKRQRNCSPSISLPGKQCIAIHVATWQAMRNRKSLLLCKQGKPVRLHYFASRVPMDGSQLGEQCSDPDPRAFLHKLVGNISQTQRSPNVRAARFLQKRFVRDIQNDTAHESVLFKYPSLAFTPK